MAFAASTKVVMKNTFWELVQEVASVSGDLRRSSSSPSLPGGLAPLLSSKATVREECTDSDDDRSTTASTSGRDRVLSWAEVSEAEDSDPEPASRRLPPGNFASGRGPPGVVRPPGVFAGTARTGPPGVLKADSPRLPSTAPAASSVQAAPEKCAAKTAEPATRPPGVLGLDSLRLRAAATASSARPRKATVKPVEPAKGASPRAAAGPPGNFAAKAQPPGNFGAQRAPGTKSSMVPPGVHTAAPKQV